MKQQTSNLEIDVDGSYEVAGSHGHANRFLRISTAFAANYFHELEMITLFGMRRYIRTAANHCENSFLLRKSLTNVRIENKNVYEKIGRNALKFHRREEWSRFRGICI